MIFLVFALYIVIYYYVPAISSFNILGLGHSRGKLAYPPFPPLRFVYQLTSLFVCSSC